MAPNYEFLTRKFGKNPSRMHCKFNIFVSAGGFKMDDFRYIAQIYNGGRHGNQILDLIAKIAQNRP